MKFGARELLFLCVMLGLLGCTYFFIFSKANAKRADLENQIRDKQQALTDLRQSTAGIEDLNHKIGELQQAIAFFESKLPQEKEVNKILEQVTKMAEANSLVCKTFKPMKPQRGPNYSEQPIQLSLSGNFNGFYSFLLQLEKLPRLTRVTQMNLQKINGSDGEMTAQMTLSIFFEPDAARDAGGVRDATASVQ